MVAHTGFLTHGRLLARRREPPAARRERARPRRPRARPRRRGRRVATRVRRARARVGRRRHRAWRSASQFVPRVVTAFGGDRPENRASVAVLFLVLVGDVRPDDRARARRARAPRHADAPAAAAVGPPRRRRGRRRSACSLCCGWSSRRSRPRRAGRRAWRAARRSSPRSSAGRRTQPARFAAWGRAISDAPFPSALGTLQSPPNPGPPPGTSITPAVNARVRASTVKVTGRACDDDPGGERMGRGAGPRRHERARRRGRAGDHGADRRRRDAAGDGDRVRSRARRRGARRSRARRERRSRRRGRLGRAVGAVYGHPGGGPLRASPARIGDEILAVGTDIYRTGSSRRHVYVLAAALAPGDSGGALVNRTRRGDRHGVRDRPRPERDRLRAHRRRDRPGARARRSQRRRAPDDR